MTLEPAYHDGPATIYHGDCIQVMRELPDASVDAVVTDPPYALEFMGKGWDKFTPGQFQNWCEEWATEAHRVLKPGGHLLAFGGMRTQHRLIAGIEDAGFEIRDAISWIYAQGFPKSHNLDGEWAGWGTALKPATEIITLARKPLVGTVAANVLQHGTGALNIDGSRIGYEALDMQARLERTGVNAGKQYGATNNVRYSNGEVAPVNPAGRWPANVILDETQATNLDTQSGITTDGTAVRHRGVKAGMYGPDLAVGSADLGYGGSGGASRFFKVVTPDPPFMYTAKAPGHERPEVDGVQHATVKPVDLMRWLVKLVTPPGGTVLEPFAGSGTTVEAAILEGFTCIAIEREPDYLPLILKRIRKPHHVGFDFGDWDGGTA